MKKPIDFGKFVFFLAATLLLSISAFAQETQPFSINNSPLPPATGFVNDFAGVIDPSTKQQLEAKLKNFKQTTDPSVELAIAVVKTTGERDIFDYSLAVARGWKIGSKDDDNPGALLFVAVDDRKYYTQISRNLEDELPDGLAGSLQRQYLVPEFKKGNYGKGISDTIDAYIATIRNKGNAPTAPPQKPVTAVGTSASGFGLFCCAVIGFIILLIILTRSKGGPTSGDRNRWGGGGFGSGGGGDVASNIASGIIGGLIGSGLSGGSSSSSDWGGSSGGDSGWGGFGGGGDFGGGGSGGDW
jgi:uncharacterized protein